MSAVQLARARKRWGKNAAVQKRPAFIYRTLQRCSACGAMQCRRKWQHSVGRVLFGMMFEPLGTGHTWAEAWQDADRREGDGR